MATLAAVLCAVGAALAVTGPTPAARRLAAAMSACQVSGRHPPPPSVFIGRVQTQTDPARSGVFSSARGRLVAALIGGAGAAFVVGGATGVAAGLVAAMGTWFGVGRLEPAARARDRERVVALLPLAADLMSAALQAGCAPDRAVAEVGEALGGPLGRRLSTAAASARLGGDPEQAWWDLANEPALRRLARALRSAALHGASPVLVLEHAAESARETARWEAEKRARSLGAKAAGPLGLCFLPAFVLAGIVPLIATSGLSLP